MLDSKHEIDERSIRKDRRVSQVLSPGHHKLNGEISPSHVPRSVQTYFVVS